MPNSQCGHIRERVMLIIVSNINSANIRTIPTLMMVIPIVATEVLEYFLFFIANEIEGHPIIVITFAYGSLQHKECYESVLCLKNSGREGAITSVVV